jgi:protein SCO1/2
MSIGILLLTLSFSLLANPGPLTQDSLRKLTFDQKIGNTVPLDLKFRDESSNSITLRDCLRTKPAILILGYYQCPMLCNLVLNGVVESLQEIKPSADAGEELIFVTIDPRETPTLAARKKATYLKRFGRAEATQRWHFLCGGDAESRALADSVGFHYQYDEQHQQFAHPSGIVVLTPEGRVSRYFFGVNYPAAELKTALEEASLKRTGSPIHALVILCSRWLPLTGKFSGTVMGAVRLLAIGTVLVLGVILFVSGRTSKGARERSVGP